MLLIFPRAACSADAGAGGWHVSNLIAYTRMARIVALAQQSLGDRESAARWLKRSNRALGNVAPVSVMDTELGARQVESVLGRIAYGGIS